MAVWKLLPPLILLLLTVACDAKVSDQEYLQRAQDFIEKGEERAAVIELKNALIQNPKNPQARRLLGELHLKAGDASAAEKELIRARDLGVNDDALLPLLASAYAQQGKYAGLLQLEPKGLSSQAEAEVLASQASALMAQRENDQAEAKIKQALKSQPNSVGGLTEQARLSIIKGDLPKARQILESLLETKAEHAPAWSLLGDLERQDKQLEKAETAYSKAIENRDNNTTDLLKRGMVRIDLKKYQDAQVDVDLVKKRFPNYYEVHYAQGQLDFRQNRITQAKESFGLALKENENYLPAMFFLGATHFQLKELEQAEALISRFVSLNPEYIPGVKLLAQIRLQERDYLEVERLMRPVFNKNTDDVSAINLLASALIPNGKIDEGAVLFEKVVSLQPQSADAHRRLGTVLLLKNEEERGVEELKAALKLDPKMQQADVVLIRYFIGKKAFDKALAATNEYLNRNPEEAAPYTLQGVIYLAMQDLEATKGAFEKARKIAPGSPSANLYLAELAVKEKDFPTARELYQEVLVHNTNHLATLIRLAALDNMQQREKEMVEHLEQAIAAHPKIAQPRILLARFHLLKGSYDQVPVVLGELQRTKSDSGVLLVLGQAQLAQRAGKKALETFSTLVEILPKSPKVHFFLGQAYALLDDKQALKNELKQAIDLDQEYLPARIALARMLLLEKNTNGVRNELVILKALAPENPDVLYIEGALANQSGDQSLAKDIFTTVFETSSNTSTMLTLARQKWAMNDRDGSLELQAQWVESHPEDNAARMALATAYTSLEENKNAISQYEVLLNRSENSPIVLNNMAWLLRDSEPERALEYATKANSLAPESAAISDTYAMILLKNNQQEKAHRMIKRALQKAPNEPSIRYHSAVIEAAAGDEKVAIRELKSLLEEDVEFPEKKEAKVFLDKLQSKH